MTDQQILTDWTPALLEEALRLEADCINRASKVPASAGVILKHGLWFQPGEMPEGFPQGRPHKCFSTCLVFTVEYPERFIYCEGMAVGVIPTHHAWLVDRYTGVMFDPTWRPEAQKVYIGVAFRFEALARWANEDDSRVGNVFDDWLHGFPAETGLIDFTRDAYSLEELPEQALHPYNAIHKGVCPQASS